MERIVSACLHGLIHRSAWKGYSAKFISRILHETASECPRKPRIPAPTAGCRPQHVVAPHKDAKPCMISGEEPYKREPDRRRMLPNGILLSLWRFSKRMSRSAGGGIRLQASGFSNKDLMPET